MDVRAASRASRDSCTALGLGGEGGAGKRAGDADDEGNEMVVQAMDLPEKLLLAGAEEDEGPREGLGAEEWRGEEAGFSSAAAISSIMMLGMFDLAPHHHRGPDEGQVGSVLFTPLCTHTPEIIMDTKRHCCMLTKDGPGIKAYSCSLRMHPKSISYTRNSTEMNLLLQLLLVESQLLALENVPIATSALAWSRRDDGIQTTGLKLSLERGIDLALCGEALGVLLVHRLARLGLGLGSGASLLLTSATELLAVVCLVPLAEGGGINLDDGSLGQRVGADELVVGGVEGDDNDTGLAGNALGGPRKVARLETQSTELAVATTRAHEMDSLGTDTGVGLLATGFESALLPCDEQLSDVLAGWNTWIRLSCKSPQTSGLR